MLARELDSEHLVFMDVYIRQKIRSPEDLGNHYDWEWYALLKDKKDVIENYFFNHTEEGKAIWDWTMSQ